MRGASVYVRLVVAPASELPDIALATKLLQLRADVVLIPILAFTSVEPVPGVSRGEVKRHSDCYSAEAALPSAS